MHQVIPDSREPCAMVAAREVDVDKPLQTCAARRAEKQQCVEHRFVDEEPKEFLYPAIQMVEIHAEHTRVLHERGVAAVGENAGRRHVVEVLPLVATSLVIISDESEIAGFREIPAGRDVTIDLKQRQWLSAGPLVRNRLLEEAVFSCRRLTPFRPSNLTIAYQYGKG